MLLPILVSLFNVSIVAFIKEPLSQKCQGDPSRRKIPGITLCVGKMLQKNIPIYQTTHDKYECPMIKCSFNQIYQLN
uniref:Secreted protein n=1 Tax=Lepeophtheirus salmonis TaxID=72036 RepID=A0A0K2T582_LEPSM